MLAFFLDFLHYSHVQQMQDSMCTHFLLQVHGAWLPPWLAAKYAHYLVRVEQQMYGCNFHAHALTLLSSSTFVGGGLRPLESTWKTCYAEFFAEGASLYCLLLF